MEIDVVLVVPANHLPVGMIAADVLRDFSFCGDVAEYVAHLCDICTRGVGDAILLAFVKGAA
jgi:hypothetical protein